MRHGGDGGGAARWTTRAGAALTALAMLSLVLTLGEPRPARAQDGTPAPEQSSQGAGNAAVRAVHGVSDAGPVDLYVDGGLAVSSIAFPGVSDALRLPAGDHDLQIVPTGDTPDQAIVDTTLSLTPGGVYEIAALGTLDDLQANVYEVDVDSLASKRARVRLIDGAPDAGSVELTADGEAVLPAVAYPNETDFVDLAAGTYDLAVRPEGGGDAVVSLPGTDLKEGTVSDLFTVGQLADGSIQALVVTTTVARAAVTGRAAGIYAGGCGAAKRGDAVAPLADLTTPAGDRRGPTEAVATESSVSSVAVSLDDILGEDHALVVFQFGKANDRIVACGEIGGALTENGALLVGLRAENGSNIAGIATLSAGVVDPATTDVTVAIAPDLIRPDTNQPVIAAAETTPPPSTRDQNVIAATPTAPEMTPETITIEVGTAEP